MMTISRRLRNVGVAVAIVAAGVIVATGSASAGVTGVGQQSPAGISGSGLDGVGGTGLDGISGGAK
jgi:hypothetical protein